MPENFEIYRSIDGQCSDEFAAHKAIARGQGSPYIGRNIYCSASWRKGHRSVPSY